MRRYGTFLSLATAVLLLSAVSWVVAEARDMALASAQKANGGLAAVDERTLVPLESVAPIFGVVFHWDAERDTVILELDNAVMEIPVHLGLAYVNGDPVELGAPVEVMNDRVMVPVGFIHEVFGAAVQYDPSKRSLHLTQAADKRRSVPGAAKLPVGGVVADDVGVIFALDGATHPRPINPPETPRPERKRVPESGIKSPEPLELLDQMWPGAILEPDGSALLPDGRTIDPATLDMIRHCRQAAPCPPLELLPECSPGLTCSEPATPSPSGASDSGSGSASEGTP